MRIVPLGIFELLLTGGIANTPPKGRVFEMGEVFLGMVDWRKSKRKLSSISTSNEGAKAMEGVCLSEQDDRFF
jgi:hypothetical protein